MAKDGGLSTSHKFRLLGAGVLEIRAMALRIRLARRRPHTAAMDHMIRQVGCSLGGGRAPTISASGRYVV